MKNLTFLFAIIVGLISCGGGGGGSQSISLLDVTGGWTGSVELFENGCPRDIPQEARTLYLTHQVSLENMSSAFSDVILNDGIGDCLAERVRLEANTFLAVCPERDLLNFISGYECREEIVWQYTVEDPSGTVATNPVVRTAYVRCYQNNQIQFACPVEYRGLVGRCIRGLC